MAEPVSYDCPECGKTFTDVDKAVDRACTWSNGSIYIPTMFCEECNKRLLAEIEEIK